MKTYFNTYADINLLILNGFFLCMDKKDVREKFIKKHWLQFFKITNKNEKLNVRRLNEMRKI